MVETKETSTESESSRDEEKLLASLKQRREGTQTPIELAKADLSGLLLNAPDLVGANLSGADLTGTILAGARLARANLRNAKLVGASLDGADLTDADLRGADLAGARIDDAVFANARLEGARLLSVLGDPLSMVDAKMDRKTVRLSEFTMRDIAEMVVRGAQVNERESMAVTLLPPVSAGAEESQGPRAAVTYSEEAPVPPELLSLSSAKPEPDALPVRSFFPPIGQVSIIPVIREAEVSARMMIADQDQGPVPASRRMFEDLNALIEAARDEQNAGQLSLRPQMPMIQRMKGEADAFPSVGDLYLGATIVEELRAGTCSRSFRAEGGEGEELVVRIFDPSCEGAALQLPAFQRGLRALNKLQGSTDSEPGVLDLVAVAADQTSYLMKFYPGGSLEELVESSLSFDKVLQAMCSLCQVVQVAHEQGLMVRSWKPSNVLVEGSRWVLAELDMVHLTTLGQYRADLFGYRCYAAPEEIIGAGTRSPTADVYSLGKMLEFLLTGEEPLVPLGGDPLIYQRENIPPVLVELVRRATSQEPEDRYQTVAELLVDLVTLQSEGDRAVLAASIRPAVLSRLSVSPLSNNPDLPALSDLVPAPRKIRKPKKESKPLIWKRQAELAAALLGGLGGLALLTVLVLSPSSVDRLEHMNLVVASAVGLSVLGLRAPKRRVILFRLGTWAAASSLIWLLNPLSLSELTWRKRLSTGSRSQKQAAVLNLARLGKGDFSGLSLSQFSFVNDDLASGNFSRTALRDTDFRGAFLLESDFNAADVTGAHFEGANLFGARLLNAEGLEEASCDRYTLLPLDLICRKGYLSYEAQKPSNEPSREPGKQVPFSGKSRTRSTPKLPTTGQE